MGTVSCNLRDLRNQNRMRVLTFPIVFVAILALFIANLTGHLEWSWLAVIVVPIVAYRSIESTAFRTFVSMRIGDRTMGLGSALIGSLWHFAWWLPLLKFVVGISLVKATVIAATWASALTATAARARVYAGSHGQKDIPVKFWNIVLWAILFIPGYVFLSLHSEWPSWILGICAFLIAQILESVLFFLMLAYIDLSRQGWLRYAT